MNRALPPEILIRPVSATDVASLMVQSTAYQESLYPPQSIHQESPEYLAKSPNLLLGAMTTEAPDTALGCVGLVLEGQEPGAGEVKALFVTEDMRGRGVGHALMDALETYATEQGVGLLRLETGIYQPESLGLYESRGYVRIPPFGHYTDDPLSVFMEKTLG